jgi:hypothetical protein
MKTHIFLVRNRNNTLAALDALGAIDIGWDDEESCWRITIDSDDGHVILLAPSLEIDMELDLSGQQQHVRLVDEEGRG